MERPAFHVGAGIDQARPPVQGRHDRHDGRPIDLGQIAQQRDGQAQHGARISGADHRAGVPVLDVLKGDAQGRVPLAAQRGHGRIAHSDDFAGVPDGDAGRFGLPEAGQFPADPLLVADQQHRHAVFLRRLDGTRHHGSGGMVSPHRVHGNLGAGQGAAVPSERCASGGAPGRGLIVFVDRDDLPAAVLAAGPTHAVGHHRVAALRAFRPLRRGQGVMGAALVAFRLRGSAFGYGHTCFLT